ncbi:MFS transporter [Altericroceibacterium endophyticum]|uniref:MFS transporter n=1 Tax=Altericroceibacterium endophyticum TaxID=1808508 RepID=A0A6I4T6I2_9SPHN|nr:MFS transporter [Altericroceibacterium endophyticum]MXO65613.1 MFS transporter [Altericroceibacterium endophyticum]
MTSTTLEQDARQLHEDGHAIAPGEIAVGVIIGRTSEFFDFFVFAIAAVLVFPSHVFPFADPLTGTLYSFGIFALAFIARPVGTLIFTGIDHRYGRGVKLTTALFLLGGSTAAIAFLPGYETIGMWSVALLALFRMGQGVALGGSWDGLASLLALNVPENRRGWYAMVPQLGAPLGLIVASLLFWFLIAALPTPDFLDWGWRYPFFVAFAINVVALFARLRIVVTPEYQTLFEQRELKPASASEVVRESGSRIVAGAFAPLASFALFHMVTVFPLSWVVLYTQEKTTLFLAIEAAAAAVGVVAIVISGALADRIGRRKVLGYCAAAIAAFSGFAPILLNGGILGEMVFMFLGFALLGLSFGQCSGALSSTFPQRLRYTASALTSDLAWLFGAGFAPLVALSLASSFGLPAAGVYLLSGALGTLAALWFNSEAGRNIE